jgi:hypothetical protein
MGAAQTLSPLVEIIPLIPLDREALARHPGKVAAWDLACPCAGKD